jgi:DNA polymerase-3 subunit gamma/tau
LLENVQYTPTQGRFKVYLIDEVHMFSTHSFNALLKTLEEPPPHVKFLLATTDPQKLPVTILSRCLQFNLKRLSGEAIRDYLAKVLEQEGIEQELPALTLIARGADGSMRDGLSLLDQAIAFGGGRVIESEVQAMLGTIGRDHVFGVIEDLAANDGAALMKRVAGQAELGVDFSAWLADLLTVLQRIALVQQVPEAIEDSLADPERIRDLAARISPEDAQLFYQIGLIGRRDLPLSPEPRGGFEMVLLRMLAFRPATGAVPAPVGEGRSGVAAATAPSGGSARRSDFGSDRGPTTAAASVSGDRDAAVPGTGSDSGPVAGGGGGGASDPGDSGTGAGRRQSPLARARAVLGEQKTAARAAVAAPAPVSPVRPGSGPAIGNANMEAGAAVQAQSVPDFPPEPPPYPDTEIRGGGGMPLPPPWEESPGEPRQELASPSAVAAETPLDTVADSPVVTPSADDVAMSVMASDATLDWLTLMPRLKLEGVVQALASHCVQRPSEPGLLTLALDPSKSGLLNNERTKRLQQAVADAVSGPLRVEIAVAHSDDASPAIIADRWRVERLRQAEQSIAGDPLVRAVQERMGATIQMDSVRALD